MLHRLHIETSSALEDMFGILHSELIDVIERAGINEIEMQFPLNQSTMLQRRALGADDPQSFLVRMIVPNESLTLGFASVGMASSSSAASSTAGAEAWAPASSKASAGRVCDE